ncbi:MAG TPA: Arm DNA-binding domain-containing protein, partial [Usitatibacter sp.]|nr:Arm DNA-binding domain-containing protein [Usitatibacter sp.]
MRRLELYRLSAKQVSNERKPGRYADGGGLYLQIGRSGSKSWLFRFMLDGNARQMGLGPEHTVALTEARKKATDCRELLLAKVDPIEARDAARTRERLAQAKGKPFKECAEAFLKANRAQWKNAKHAAQWKTTLESYCYPIFGDLPVSKIDTGHVLEAIEPIWQSKRETAARVRGRIEKILDWATVRRYREGLNPARWRGHL